MRFSNITYLVCMAASFVVVSSTPAQAFDSSKFIFHFHGPDTASTIGARLTSLGDVNGDGYDDIAVTSQVPDGTFIFFGGEPPDTLPDMLIRGGVGASSPIDLDGDGIDDLVVSDTYKIAGNEHGVVFFFRGFGDSLGSQPYDSLLPDSINYGFGGFVATAYVDSDSLGDLLLYEWASGSGSWLHFYSGCPAIDTVADWTIMAGGDGHHMSPYGFGFIDFNGDSAPDIFYGASGGGEDPGYVNVYYGPDFGQQPSVVLGVPAEHPDWEGYRYAQYVTNLGDVNADGWDDLGVICDFHPLVYFGGPSADTVYDVQLVHAWEFAGVGDINGDGGNDIVCGQTRGYRGAVDIYLGGYVLGSYWDATITANDLPPLFLDYLGRAVAGAGDFNGDGYGDFMFTCGNFAHGEPWDVFLVAGGPYIETGISESSSLESLPAAFDLLQNYPNPFNGGTTITFVLAKRSRVTIEVFNVLGQCVRTLISDVVYSQGNHSVYWDGCVTAGWPAPSGVYFSRMSSQSGHVESRKMMLIK